jgi:hypothetical protein
MWGGKPGAGWAMRASPARIAHPTSRIHCFPGPHTLSGPARLSSYLLIANLCTSLW